ncbi:MAG: multicopper oxidase domain-containing protein, partial [Alphaproteobacteria bacterium]|nr:multicopper oxidase domain-containing protein [Alphaproteobacteria bacterium]
EDSDDPLIEDELHGIIQSVNGRRQIDLTMAPGETQLWRIGNQSSNLLFHLRLAGHRFRVIAVDGGLRREEAVEEVLHLHHGSRVDVLVERQLGRLGITGDPLARGPVAPVAAEAPDLRRAGITAERIFSFTQERDESRFYIDGRVFDHNRTDVTVRHGSVERWTIRNDSDDIHTFHIHQLHFQAVAVNGRAVPFTGHVDTIRIPERGSVTVIIPFTGALIAGRFVFHCHVLKHEDRGMMASIEVLDDTITSRVDGALRRIDLLVRQISLIVFALRNGMPLEWCGL